MSQECLGAVCGMLVNDVMPHSMSLWLCYQAYLDKGRSRANSDGKSMAQAYMYIRYCVESKV